MERREVLIRFAVRMPVDEIAREVIDAGGSDYIAAPGMPIHREDQVRRLHSMWQRGSDRQSGYDRRRWCCGDWRGINDTGCDSRAADVLQTRSNHEMFEEVIGGGYS